MTTVITKFTTELGESEIDDILLVFKEIFHKERTPADFSNEYLNTARGYSYHALAIDDGHIVGHNAYIPFDYKIGEESVVCVLSVDAMITPEYRGRGLYKRLLLACSSAAQADGCELRIGFPNENSYPIQVRAFDMKKIGELRTYCLPVRLSGLSKRFVLFDILSIPISFCIVALSALIPFGRNNANTKYRWDYERMPNYRFKWYNADDYKIVEASGFRFVYKTADFKGIPATFLMDVEPLSRRNLDKACRYIFFHEFKQLSLLLYVGNLPFTPFSLITVPKRFEPKQFNVIGKCYGNSPEDFYSIKNWKLNLSNTDLL